MLGEGGLWMHRAPDLVKRYYEASSTPEALPWKLGRKHIRIVTSEGRFIKLNTIRNRINQGTFIFSTGSL
jgi:hypothetical protein